MLLADPVAVTLTCFEHNDIVSEARHFIDCVADKDSRNPEAFRQRLDIRQDFAFSSNVQRCQWLVEQQQLGLCQQCATDRHSLTFSTRQNVDFLFQQRLEIQSRNDFVKADIELLADTPRARA